MASLSSRRVAPETVNLAGLGGCNKPAVRCNSRKTRSDNGSKPKRAYIDLALRVDALNHCSHGWDPLLRHNMRRRHLPSQTVRRWHKDWDQDQLPHGLAACRLGPSLALLLECLDMRIDHANLWHVGLHGIIGNKLLQPK